MVVKEKNGRQNKFGWSIIRSKNQGGKFMSEEKNEQSRKMGQIIAKTWTDATFKQKLLSDPVAILREEGMDLPPGIEIRAVENTDEVFYLVLPSKPSGELTDELLEKVAEGRGGVYDCLLDRCARAEKCPASEPQQPLREDELDMKSIREYSCNVMITFPY
jgi:hypothetical protein